ncbi:hypothetical protein ILYODFUR_004950 [Ilyodon furcidens]|uniref:Uncharacterized protein n=1 Tax=Ilyodon furcidens TaxID=33524 RepID=A0ABV0VE06_9TELE
MKICVQYANAYQPAFIFLPGANWWSHIWLPSKRSPYHSSGNFPLDLLPRPHHKSTITYLLVQPPTIHHSTAASSIPPQIRKQSSSESTPHIPNLPTSTPLDVFTFFPGSSPAHSTCLPETLS